MSFLSIIVIETSNNLCHIENLKNISTRFKKWQEEKKNESKKPNPTARSTAAIFQDINNLDELESKTKIDNNKSNKETNDEPAGSPEEDIANAGFPFNYLYRVQDHLNENMSVVHAVQCLVSLFFIQMVYLDRVKIIDYSKDEHLPMQVIAVIFSIG